MTEQQEADLAKVLSRLETRIRICWYGIAALIIVTLWKG